MNKISLLMLSLILVVAQGFAQGTISVNVPLFRKIVKVTTEVANLRKTASLNSPILMVVEDYDDMGESYFELSWSSSAVSNAKIVKPEVLLVTNVLDDWYEVLYFTDNGLSHKKAYIMKRYCVDAETVPFASEALAIVQTGKFKNYCLECVEVCGGEYLSFGRVINNIYVFISGYSATPGNVTRMEQYGFEYSKDFRNAYGMLDVKKLSYSNTALISLHRNSKKNKSCKMNFKIKGDDSIHTMYWNDEVLSMMGSEVILF